NSPVESTMSSVERTWLRSSRKSRPRWRRSPLRSTLPRPRGNRRGACVPPPPGAVLLDANVFVSAIKSLPRVTGSFRLIVRLIDHGVRLVGNEVLAEEYLRYAQSLPSPTASALAASILSSMEIIHVEDRFVRACAFFFGAGSAKYCVHAATRLQLGAALVSYDHVFYSIGRVCGIRCMTVSCSLSH